MILKIRLSIRGIGLIRLSILESHFKCRIEPLGSIRPVIKYLTYRRRKKYVNKQQAIIHNAKSISFYIPNDIKKWFHIMKGI